MWSSSCQESVGGCLAAEWEQFVCYKSPLVSLCESQLQYFLFSAECDLVSLPFQLLFAKVTFWLKTMDYSQEFCLKLSSFFLLLTNICTFCSP